MSGECLLITETGRADDGILGYGTFPADFATDPNVDGVVKPLFQTLSGEKFL